MATIFAEKSHMLLGAVLDCADIDAGLMELFKVYQSQALDPNVNRKKLMDQWGGLNDYQWTGCIRFKSKGKLEKCNHTKLSISASVAIIIW